MASGKAREKAAEPAREDELTALKPRWHATDFFGLVLGLVPFALSYSVTVETFTSDTGHGLELGRVSTRHADYVALAGGAAAVASALVGLALIGTMRSRGQRFGVFAALLALGIFQIVRGMLAGMHLP